MEEMGALFERLVSNVQVKTSARTMNTLGMCWLHLTILGSPFY